MPAPSHYTLTLTRDQTRALKNALHEFVRIGTGDLNGVSRLVPARHDWHNACRVAGAMEEIQPVASAIGKLSPGHPKVRDDVNTAWDIEQVVRHQFAEDGLSSGQISDCRIVDFDRPSPAGTEPLPTIVPRV